MEGTVEIARAITITYQTHRPNGKRQKSFDLDQCNCTVRYMVHVNSTSTKHDAISVAVPQQTGAMSTGNTAISEPVAQPTAISAVDDDLPPPRRNLG